MNTGLVAMIITIIFSMAGLMYLAAKKKVTNKHGGSRAKGY